jgi:hypothetical protein
MDLKQLDTKQRSNEGVMMDIVYPGSGEATGVRIRVAGIDSDRFNEFARQRSKQAVQHAASGGKKEEDSEDYAVDLLAACTIDWEGVEYDGQELECTRENAKWVYTEFPAIRRQVNRFIMQERNFLSLSPEA